MAQTLEERVAELENKVVAIEQSQPKEKTNSLKGWRSILGISANDPHFDEVVRLGREWRNADRPNDDDAPKSDKEEPYHVSAGH